MLKRTKRRPPEGQRCDTRTCVDYTHVGPRILKCQNLATVVLENYASTVWLCEACAKAIEERQSKEKQ